jgi:hypothetical protein
MGTGSGVCGEGFSIREETGKTEKNKRIDFGGIA